MTRKICCNPLKHHKKQYLKDLNPVSATAISTGLVNEGDLICSGCRKKLFEKLKPKKTVENSECDSSRAAPQPINEEVASVIQPNEEAANEIQPSNEVAAADIQPSNGVAAANIQPPNGEVSLSESEESTEVESLYEDSIFEESLDENDVLSASNSALTALGESPVKRRGLTQQQRSNKIRRKTQSFKENLEIAYGVNNSDEDEDDIER